MFKKENEIWLISLTYILLINLTTKKKKKKPFQQSIHIKLFLWIYLETYYLWKHWFHIIVQVSFICMCVNYPSMWINLWNIKFVDYINVIISKVDIHRIIVYLYLDTSKSVYLATNVELYIFLCFQVLLTCLGHQLETYSSTNSSSWVPNKFPNCSSNCSQCSPIISVQRFHYVPMIVPYPFLAYPISNILFPHSFLIPKT
jgi:hypothetical protein